MPAHSPDPDERRPVVARARLLCVLGALVSLVVLWVLGRPLPEIEEARRHFVELQRQVTAARESRAVRTADRGRVMRLRAQARLASGGQRDAFVAEADALESRTAWGDRAQVRAIVLDAPLVSLRRTTAQPTDVMPVFSATRSTCGGCHVAVATAGFERYPAPLRTHPQVSAYVGAASPHPPSRVTCVACHGGDEHATSFEAAGHTRMRATRADEPRPRAWTSVDAPGAMLPVGRSEASCASCHDGEVYQPGAATLNEAFATIERAGCYACHDVPGLESAPRRGPDLRRVRGKLSREWVTAWLADPRAMKPSTWMPRLWSGRAVLTSDQRVEIDAVVAYLFANADDYRPADPSPPPGDAARGQQIVQAVGCLGCHIVGNTPRDSASPRRTFGQPLQGLAGKSTYAWLVDWVRQPSRYSPDTRMPSLRLTAGEAADVATYLHTLDPSVPDTTGAPVERDDAYRAVVDRYGAGELRADAALLTGEPLRIAAGRAVIARLGCSNCHAIRGFDAAATRRPFGARRVWRDEAGVAVHAAPTAIRPDGGAADSGAAGAFGQTEGARFALALTSVTRRTRESHGLGTPWQVTRAKGRRLVQERNCVGCHSVDGVGGDMVALLGEPSLGPPLLTPEGSRVRPEWLREFLHQPTTIRPWLAVRMPTFGLSDDDVEMVGNYFRAIAPENPTAAPASASPTPAAGRELFDLLKCQQCHVLGTLPAGQPPANLAPDLRLARSRLQPEWILAWLRNPSAVLPGTRMPSFWPEYPRSFYEPLDKDASAQVRAIRDHLLTLH